MLLRVPVAVPVMQAHDTASASWPTVSTRERGESGRRRPLRDLGDALGGETDRMRDLGETGSAILLSKVAVAERKWNHSVAVAAVGVSCGWWVAAVETEEGERDLRGE